MSQKIFLNRGIPAGFLVVFVLAGGCALARADSPPPPRLPAPAATTTQAASVSVSGLARPGLEPFDELMTSFVADKGIPGAALAVCRNGKLVYARGFGYADRQTRQVVQPDSLFRIASVSKPFTAVAIMQLVDRGKLRLDDRAFGILKIHPPPKSQADPRLAEITIRQLLQHTGGWDRDRSGDPMFMSVVIARQFGTPPPATPPQIISFMMGRPLDLEPGTKSVYSNFGFCVLGRIIEQLSGETYEHYVRAHVLEPVGIRTMRIGRSLPDGRFPGEVHYYDSHNRTGSCVFAAELGKKVPEPYGAWYQESLDSHGGWIATAGDVVRFAAALDDREHCKILSAASIRAMFAAPPLPASQSATQPAPPQANKRRESWYACGWLVRPAGARGGINTWHTGSLPGTNSLLVRRYDGLDWAVLFNTEACRDGQPPCAAIDGPLHKAADAVTHWPAPLEP